MDTSFNSAELRAAAQQAIMISLRSWCPTTRKSLLETAERLLSQADAHEKAMENPKSN
jgi:hypothetical protein